MLIVIRTIILSPFHPNSFCKFVSKNNSHFALSKSSSSTTTTMMFDDDFTQRMDELNLFLMVVSHTPRLFEYMDIYLLSGLLPAIEDNNHEIFLFFIFMIHDSLAFFSLQLFLFFFVPLICIIFNYHYFCSSRLVFLLFHLLLVLLIF